MGRSGLKAGVEVNACKHGMVESLYFLSVIRSDASTEDEGCIPLVVVEYRPVELCAISAHHLSLRVEEEIVGGAFVGLGLF